MEVIQDEIVEYRVYKEKPYLNSAREPFGLTINGKTKEYMKAHDTIREIVKKGKTYIVDKGKMKILDVTNNKALINAIVEVDVTGVVKGNVELKIHMPGKKKGATLELRKLSAFEYTHVQLLANIIKSLLDGFIAGGTIQQVIKNVKADASKPASKVTSKPKLFECNLCHWETRFSSALKAHVKKMHCRDEPFKCNLCEYTSNTNFALEEHITSAHKTNKKRPIEITSPSSSPPSKKQDGPANVFIEISDSEVEMMDIEIEATDAIKRLLEQRIKELESKVEEVESERKREEELKNILEEEVKMLKDTNHKQKALEVPNHLASVHKKHLSKLRGYRLKYNSKPNGACLENSAAVHIYENEDDGSELKKRINNHIADNWDNFYQYKIPLPYTETVGVGENSHVIKKSTKSEIIDFLRSKESLTVYSNYQELLAISNIFNIKINVFTYRDVNDGNWKEITPDPEMVSITQAKYGKWIPDMALYNQDQTHYDLLVKDDSRIALLGLLAGCNNEEKTNGIGCDEKEERVQTNAVHENNDADWKEVVNKRRKESQRASIGEKLLTEDITADVPSDLSKDLVEEISLLKTKNSGFRRAGPQESPLNMSNGCSQFRCDQCDFVLESQGLLDAHILNHEETPISSSNCEDCDQTFTTERDLADHIQNEHTKPSNCDEWLCNECPFQANTADELLKHLRVTGHQPSNAVNDKAKNAIDFKECYTCKMQFNGYYNLMEHRKNVHPSSKKCRNYPASCTFGEKCWYVHEQPMEVDLEKDVQQTSSNFKCNVCDEEFKERVCFMKHKKTEHPNSILECQNFKRGKCQRTDELCWFKHTPVTGESKTPTQGQVFQEAPANLFPPEQFSRMLQMVDTLCQKVEQMEKRILNLTN